VVLVPRRGEICQRGECDETPVDSAHRWERRTTVSVSVLTGVDRCGHGPSELQLFGRFLVHLLCNYNKSDKITAHTAVHLEKYQAIQTYDSSMYCTCYYITGSFLHNFDEILTSVYSIQYHLSTRYRTVGKLETHTRFPLPIP
jgi:hypothetical protein